MKLMITDIPKTKMGYAIGLNLATVDFVAFTPSDEELKKMQSGQRSFDIADKRISH